MHQAGSCRASLRPPFPNLRTCLHASLCRALEKLPNSPLVAKLLGEGADPSIPCQLEGKREQMSAVHFAAAQGCGQRFPGHWGRLPRFGPRLDCLRQAASGQLRCAREE